MTEKVNRDIEHEDGDARQASRYDREPTAVAVARSGHQPPMSARASFINSIRCSGSVGDTSNSKWA